MTSRVGLLHFALVLAHAGLASSRLTKMEEVPFHKNFLLAEKVSESQLDKMGIGGLIG